MSESFFLSNMSPQVPSFNRGIWKQLESLVRHWAVVDQAVHVVTGPVLRPPTREAIGANTVMIPTHYYKVVLDYRKPVVKAIGLILPNERASKPLTAFVVTVDRVEQVTGLDFFSRLPDALEERLESAVDKAQWQWTPRSHKTPTASPSPNAPVPRVREAIAGDRPYAASRRSAKFHKADCRYVQSIKADDLVGYAARPVAVADGKVPCKACTP